MKGLGTSLAVTRESLLIQTRIERLRTGYLCYFMDVPLKYVADGGFYSFRLDVMIYYYLILLYLLLLNYM